MPDPLTVTLLEWIRFRLTQNRIDARTASVFYDVLAAQPSAAAVAA